MTNFNPKAILFDLGGVLIQLNGLPLISQWTNWNDEEIWEQWLSSPTVRLFESGKITAENFSQEITAEFNLPITPDEYLTGFSTWMAGLYPGAKELLSDLSSNYLLGCLSNTNSLHWADLENTENILQKFDYLLPSHLTGYLKPDPESFHNAAKEMALQPKDILFLDDNIINVSGALATGMVAYKVSGTDGARNVLNNLGIL